MKAATIAADENGNSIAFTMQTLLKRAAAGLASPPLFFMTDARIGDPRPHARALPGQSAIIYRHFGHIDRVKIAHDLRQIAFSGDHLFLIGADPDLALNCGADGVHFPQNDMSEAQLWRGRVPSWFLSCAVHDMDSVIESNAAPLDAVILSPVFKSGSPSAASPLGMSGFTKLASLSSHPVIALGGISRANIVYLDGGGAAGYAGVSMFKV